MVRVFRCLRFASQSVVSAASEPTVICSDADRLFVACDNYNIEEFCTDNDGCHKIRQFAAIGRILQMAYSHEGEFVATIEEDIVKSSNARSQCSLSLRVYTNLAAISNGRPMKVRIAGQVTRARAHHTGPVLNVDQLVVIEVPLKRPVTCIAAYGNNVAIGIRDTVLVYACDRFSDTSRDIRCILELEFGFKVRKIELCEEFIMCSSGMECQIVQLNFDVATPSVIGYPSHMTGPVTVRSFFEHSALRAHSPNKNAKFFKMKELIEETISHDYAKCCNRNGHTKPSVVDGSVCEHCQKAEVNKNGEPDEKLVVADCPKEEALSEEEFVMEMNSKLSESKRHLVRQTPVSSCRSNSPPIPLPIPPSSKPKSKLKETIGGGVELLGPVSGNLPTCAVNVEFEGMNRDGSGRSGVLRNGVTTLLFKKLDYCSSAIHSIQLLPVFLDEDPNSSNIVSSNVFLSAKRKQLVGLFSVIGTPNYAYVYSLLYDCRLISSFPYAVETSQVRLTENHLFAISSSRLDVYTARCLSRLIFDLEETANEMQQTLPFISEEPCLIGYHTFFGLTAMCQTGGYITVLSKSASSQSSDNSWSIYSLRRPELTDLYNDMTEQAKEWEKSHSVARTEENEERQLAVSLCLMQEANMLLRSQLYLRRWTEEKKELIALLKKSSLYLAHAFERHETDGHLAVPYYLMAGYSPMDIARRFRDSEAKISYRSCEALVWYAKKLADPLTIGDVVDEIANAGIVNGCLRKLRAIAYSNDELNSKRLSCFGDTSKLDLDKTNETSSVDANFDSVTNLIHSDLEVAKLDSLPR